MDNTNAADGSLNAGLEDLAAYALDALEPIERARVERLLAVSEEARLELQELQEGAEALSYTAGELAPPASLKSKILNLTHAPTAVAGRIAAITPEPVGDSDGGLRIGARLSALRLTYLGSSFAMLGIIALAIFFGVQNDHLSRHVEDLNGEIAESRSTIDGLQSTVVAASGTIDQQNTQIDSLESSLKDLRWTTYVVTSGNFNFARWLWGGQNAPEADGTLWVSTSQHSALFQVNGLPAQPSGKEYHLWLEGADQSGEFRNDVAIFDVDSNGTATVQFTVPSSRSIYDYDRALVTLEDAAQFGQASLTGDEVMSSR